MCIVYRTQIQDVGCVRYITAAIAQFKGMNTRNTIHIKLRSPFLFLQHPEGIYLSSLSEHRQELYTIYAQISAMGDLQEMKLRIDDMVNALGDSASQKMSRIKRVFEEAVGKTLATHYYIKGESGQKKCIELNRTMVIFEKGNHD